MKKNIFNQKNKPYEKIGLLIRQKRLEKGLTQQALAEQLNCAKRNISFWECGDRIPTPNFIQSLCNILGILPTDFSTVNENQPPIEVSKKSILLLDFLEEKFDISFLSQHEKELFSRNSLTVIKRLYEEMLNRKAEKIKSFAQIIGTHRQYNDLEVLEVNHKLFFLLDDYKDGTYHKCYRLNTDNDEFEIISDSLYKIHKSVIQYENKKYIVDWKIIPLTGNDSTRLMNKDFSIYNLLKANLNNFTPDNE